MRVSITHPSYSYPYRDRGPLAAIPIEYVVVATRCATTHPESGARILPPARVGMLLPRFPRAPRAAREGTKQA